MRCHKEGEETKDAVDRRTDVDGLRCVLLEWLNVRSRCVQSAGSSAKVTSSLQSLHPALLRLFTHSATPCAPYASSLAASPKRLLHGANWRWWPSAMPIVRRMTINLRVCVCLLWHPELPMVCEMMSELTRCMSYCGVVGWKSCVFGRYLEFSIICRYMYLVVPPTTVVCNEHV